jgi:putative CocE/NonD family hydrolase
MGENQWRYEREWPLARTQYTKYYLHSTGRANSLNGDGTLDTKPAGSTEPVDTFVYDPLRPVPTLGGSNCCWTDIVPIGPFDQRAAERRDDVLVFTTPELSQPVEVTGPITVKLFASTTAKDTDWTAKLVDVEPNGYARNIQDGIIRARYREGLTTAKPIEPARPYEYTLDLWATSNVFLSHHRIRVEISSSNFPRFDRNLNTGNDPRSDTTPVFATQTIYHNQQYPSHIVLPVIPKTTASSTQ